MNKATLIYARVSSTEQAEMFSISAQLKSLQEYAQKNNFDVVKEFIDVETAKKAGRTQFMAMLKFIKEQPSNITILVEKTDRLLRNIADYATLDNLITHSGLTVHLVKENTILHKDSRSNEKFIFGIKALMSKNYVDNLSEEVNKGMTEKASQGYYPSVAPVGYKNHREGKKSTIVVDPIAAIFVRKAYELYSTGSYSLFTLRKKMMADGIVYREGKPIYKTTLSTILTNPFYTGVFMWKGKLYENAQHEPLIDKEMFQRVQEILINPHKSKSRKGLFPFTNLITCGGCGCKFTAELKKGLYIYYHCSKSKGKCLPDHIRQEAIDDLFTQLFTRIQIPENIRQIILQGIRDSFKDKIAYHNSLIEQLNQHLKRLQNRIDQAYLDKLDGKIGEDFWQTKTKEWSTEKDNILTKLHAAQRADINYLENAEFILELSKNAAQMFKSGSVEKKRRIINILTSNCVYQSGNIDVELKPVFAMILNSVKNEEWCAWQDSNLQPTDSKSGTLSIELQTHIY